MDAALPLYAGQPSCEDLALILLDTGAWNEKYRDSTGSVRPNAQLSVICGNDVRIYQFDQR